MENVGHVQHGEEEQKKTGRRKVGGTPAEKRNSRMVKNSCQDSCPEMAQARPKMFDKIIKLQVPNTDAGRNSS